MRQLTLTQTNKLEWLNVPEPHLEGAADALVRPIAVARCDVDLPMVQGLTPFQMPIAVGHEFVGEVVETGTEVQSFQPGQRVIVTFQISCGRCRMCARGVTNSCEAVPPRSQFGFGQPGAGWGSALSDIVRVPYAEHMLVPLPGGVEPEAIASPDDLADGWRAVGPYLQQPGAAVLIVAGRALSVALYAAAIAVALGARVDYIDSDRERLALASSVGANAVEGPASKALGPYPITVDASADVNGLAYAIRSTEPGGTCTSVGIYFAELTPVPLLEMFVTGITFKTGRVNARTDLLPVLDLVRQGIVKPELLTTRTVSWEEAPRAWAEPATKLVVKNTDAPQR